MKTIIVIFLFVFVPLKLSAQFAGYLPQELAHLFVPGFVHYPDSNFLYKRMNDIINSEIKMPISVEIVPITPEPATDPKNKRKHKDDEADEPHFVNFTIENQPTIQLRSFSVYETDLAPYCATKIWNDSIVVGICSSMGLRTLYKSNYELLSKLSCMFYKYDTINNTLDALEACCLDFEEYTKTHPDGILQSIEIFSPDMIFICYRDWQEKLNRYVLLQLVGDKVEILPVATAFPFLPPEAYEKNDTDTH
ncbi:MAG: hypothetical protein R2798_08075 [Chitinophagales bacterium]|nr:hypothetical protein [Bacteroidota bacterium]MCB9042391.1 hypothetical protein [Chitinophagales bacterium]